MGVLDELDALRQRLRSIRKEAGFNQAAIGDALDLADHSFVSKMETGKVDPDAAQLLKWADACGYTLRLVPRDFTIHAKDAADLLALLEPADRGRVVRLAQLLLTMPDQLAFVRDIVDKDLLTYETLQRTRS